MGGAVAAGIASVVNPEIALAQAGGASEPKKNPLLSPA